MLALIYSSTPPLRFIFGRAIGGGTTSSFGELREFPKYQEAVRVAGAMEQIGAVVGA